LLADLYEATIEKLLKWQAWLSGNRFSLVENISSSDETVIALLLKLPGSVRHLSVTMKMRPSLMTTGVVTTAGIAGGLQIRLSA